MARAKKIDRLTMLRDLPPGSEFRTPDCHAWGETLKGWPGKIVSHSTGSTLIVRGSERLAVSSGTEVIVITRAPVPK